MPRMIDTIRKSALPSNMMLFAARGALLVPPQEMIEILVYLVNHNKVFGPQARLTLAGWDEKSSHDAAADPATPKEVLDYLIDPENLRPVLLPVLLENPSVSEKFLMRLAVSATREQTEILLNSPRASRSKEVLEMLAANRNLTDIGARSVREKLSAMRAESGTVPAGNSSTSDGAVDVTAEIPPEGDAVASDHLDESADVPDETVMAFMSEHGAEIAAEGNKPFQPLGGTYEELPSPATEAPAELETAAAMSAGAGASPAGGVAPVTTHPAAPKKKSFVSMAHEKGSALKKIALLDVKGRINLAMKGNKEERSLLIRDGTKVVALAVLESPKVTDGEVEKFASQKNVLEAVLRAIPMKRRFFKQYAVIRNLASNPRTPIDVSLGLLKHLLIQDLRNLAGNKEVSDTVRKLATKMFRQKLDTTKKS